MRRIVIGLVVVASCVSAPVAREPVEGKTASGIAYDVRGSGPTVVLIHGGILDRRMWNEEAHEWAPRFRVVRYDLRGHGQSDNISGPFSAVDDLAAVLDAVRASRAHLVGLSLGSRVALDFALTHPRRVDRLVLAGPFPSGMPVTERVPGLDSLIAAARRGDTQRAAAITADMPAFAVPPDKVLRVRSIVMSNARVYAQSPTAERQLSTPAIQRLGEVRTPTLIILGDGEGRDIKAGADSLLKGIRGAQRVVVPGAGHLVNVWAGREFTRVVTAFLRGERVEVRGSGQLLEPRTSNLEPAS